MSKRLVHIGPLLVAVVSPTGWLHEPRHGANRGVRRWSVEAQVWRHLHPRQQRVVHQRTAQKELSGHGQGSMSWRWSCEGWPAAAKCIGQKDAAQPSEKMLLRCNLWVTTRNVVLKCSFSKLQSPAKKSLDDIRLFHTVLRYLVSSLVSSLP